MKALLLGPHPGFRSLSIEKYFSFYQSMLPPFLPGWDVTGDCPGSVTATGRAISGSDLLRTRWDNFVSWPFTLSKIRGDLVHVVDQGLAWYGEFLTGGRRLITVHDLIAYMTWKGGLDFGSIPMRRKPLLWRCVRQIQKADHLVTVSNCTAGHLVSVLGITASKITVVPNVLETCFSPLSKEERSRARARWFGDSEYAVIHVGKASSYKNRIGALRSFDRLRQQLPSARMFLIHGTPDRQESEFLAECSNPNAIRFLPLLSRTELREFYGAADALIFPSLYEGFGWPPLEAMACGCPVVSTTCGSLAEVVGDAALTLSDPNDHQRIADLTYSILTENAMMVDLRMRGLERAKLFAPEVALNRVAEVYRAIASC